MKSGGSFGRRDLFFHLRCHYSVEVSLLWEQMKSTEIGQYCGQSMEDVRGTGTDEDERRAERVGSRGAWTPLSHDCI